MVGIEASPRDPAGTCVKAVIFDMDGVVLDSEPIYRAASRSAAAELGYEFGDDLYERLIGRNDEDVQAEILHCLGEHFPMEEFHVRWRRHWEAIVRREGVAVKTGVPEVLSLLRACAVPFAIATSTEFERATYSLSAAGLAGVFETLVAGDHVHRGKPAPDIYRLAARRLGVAEHACVALEDSEAGVKSAAAAGMLTLMVPDLKMPSQVARSLAYRVVGDLTEAIPVLESLVGGA